MTSLNTILIQLENETQILARQREAFAELQFQLEDLLRQAEAFVPQTLNSAIEAVRGSLATMKSHLDAQEDRVRELAVQAGDLGATNEQLPKGVSTKVINDVKISDMLSALEQGIRWHRAGKADIGKLFKISGLSTGLSGVAGQFSGKAKGSVVVSTRRTAVVSKNL